MELVKGGYQLVPPNIHQHSAAERAIKTFKNYLVSKLAGFKKKSVASMVQNIRPVLPHL